MRRRRHQEALEHSSREAAITSGTSRHAGLAREDRGVAPGGDHTSDPAPTRHAALTEGQRIQEKSKYEASEPFRSRKGDRFS